MKMKEMREHGASELESMKTEMTRELWKARFSNFTNQLDDTAKLRRLRRDLARIKTLLAELARKQPEQTREQSH
jgi:large subunit ribosomal protein L29